MSFGWVTADGRCFEADEIPNDHLVNIVRWCKNNSLAYGDTVIAFFEGVAIGRGIDESLLVGEPIPFRGRHNRLMTYSEDARKYVEIKR